jgi:hypothetical protein
MLVYIDLAFDATEFPNDDVGALVILWVGAFFWQYRHKRFSVRQSRAATHRVSSDIRR